MNQENWKDIENYEDRYEISDCGTVKSKMTKKKLLKRLRGNIILLDCVKTMQI